MKITAFDAPFGASITGLDLSKPMDTVMADAVNDAFVENAVLCFRDQHFSSPDNFLAAAEQLGQPMAPVTKTYRLEGYDVIEELTNHATDPRTGDAKPLSRGGSWHTDHSNLSIPPKATVLYAIDIPEQGGNTEFINLSLAYAALDQSLQKRIKGRRVFEAYLSRRAPRPLLTRTKEEEQGSSGAWQPLVRRHPESGQPSLYLNPMRDDAVEGLTQVECDELLDELYAHCDQPPFFYSHRWSQGDVLIWDNRCCWHRATFDFDAQLRRYLHRIMLAGDQPAIMGSE